ncbi:bifunctional homocysteine S-methyltransferase/methylenetetrahydrofolate reductase [Gracilibacillus caseinilyticus]|uniref:Bifunctional homocysteine S-methyltransferase/methylenetetrahydrofolate reductase n=1 Tax=Gracilibacillus caseinilyticus TaxID=2932256 RepID=A0ABY4F0B7_9BACI|nr:bifunctional homocysteine S-methyltransferase/methylenetetrahydrofolate reductase [Gracilibacillus caseinilyticus]UOQ50108.1 bifunctional homocysteine S-methyltransferase/methylenetetrahydrofolate reductase [Gracilibacillus caseinilyticus]
MPDILTSLRDRLVVADGAIGTLLYAHGVDRCFESYNLSHPDEILRVHQSYLDAGSEVIQTNTYGANYIKLTRFGLEDRVHHINSKAVKIAKSAAGDKAAVLGTMGGIRGVQKLVASRKEIVRSFKEQLFTLLLEGVDGILLETYYDFEEIQEALQIAREETNIPIITNVSMHEPGVLENGISLPYALAKLEELGADVVGVNCHLGPYYMLKALESVPLLENAYLAAYPNASLPAYDNGKLVYSERTQYFEQCAKDFRDQGVRLLGGCCGTTPEHIRAFKDGVKDLTPLKEKEVKTITFTPEQQATPPQRVTLADKARQEHTVIVELDAPKHLDTNDFIEGVFALEKAGVDAITLADNSLATPRISNVAMAVKMKELGCKVKPLIHLTCRDRNLIGLQSHLLGMHTLGFDEILAITGDPTRIGGFPGASSVFDVTSFELTRLIKQCNQGLSFSGSSLKTKTNFQVAAAFNPNVANLEKAVKRMEKKIEHGADYFLTQPIFNHEQIIQLHRLTKNIDKPIFIGIMPLTSHRNAEFLHNEVPGMKLSDEVRSRMQQHQNRHDSRREGINIAKELIDTAIQYFNGIYIVTPFMHYPATAELTEYVHQQTKAVTKI